MKAFWLFLLLPIIQACDRDRLDIPVPEKRVEVKVERLDQDMFSYSGPQDSLLLNRMKKEYGPFFTQIVGGILGFGNPEAEGFAYGLQNFVGDADMNKVYSDITRVFPAMVEAEQGLSEAFTYYHHYFPDSLIPRVVSFHSGFNYALVTSDSVLGIGLEMFLGEDYSFYKMLGYPAYMTHNMNPASLVPAAMRGWIGSSLGQDVTGMNLLQVMIRQGKIHYITRATMPHVAYAELFGVTDQKHTWFTENERMVWAYLVDNELLYSSSLEVVNKITSEGPFTPGLPRESPGGVGKLIGYSIVEAYMEKHPEVSLAGLMDKEAEEILKKSNYRP